MMRPKRPSGPLRDVVYSFALNMASAAQGGRKVCDVSRRVSEIDVFLNDERRERMTDLVREHMDICSLAMILNEEGWAGVVAALPRRVR